MRDPLLMIGIYYLYFSFGPILNIALGNNIYFGIIEDRISQATTIFALGTLGLFIGSLSLRLNLPSSEDIARVSQTNLFGFNFVLGLVIVYSAFILFTIGFTALAIAGKLDRISLISPQIHYPYLLLQFFLISFYFLARNHRLMFRLYLLNAALYCAYCLIFNERDFVFLAASILFFAFIISDEKRRSFALIRRGALIGVTLITWSVFAFSARMETPGGFVESMLNQGSLLFINTQILEYIDLTNYLLGETYVNSMLSVLPGFLYEADYSLSTWFVDYYAPGGRSGYGFALDAEAYLNFGYLGVVVFFGLIAVGIRLVFATARQTPMGVFFSVFLMAFIMYAIRNDSLGLVNATFYAFVFYLFVLLLSIPALKVTNTNAPDRHA